MFSLQIHVTSGADIAVYPPGATFGPRTMSEWEFVWLLEGKAVFEVHHGAQVEKIELLPGQLLLCQPNQKHSFTWDARKRTRHGFFHFDLLECGNFWPQPQLWPQIQTFDDAELLGALMRHLVQIRGLKTSPQGEMQTDLAATLLLSAFLTGATSLGELGAAPAPDPVERALNWMFQTLENDPAAPIELSDLARAAFVSPEHLCRVFRASTGRSPLETVRLARLDRAALLLARSNFSVGEVARLCGFASPFHFSRVFKAAYGISPQALRVSLNNGALMPISRLSHVLPRDA
jgi:AraC-like DNA-binding protein